MFAHEIGNRLGRPQDGEGNMKPASDLREPLTPSNNFGMSVICFIEWDCWSWFLRGVLSNNWFARFHTDDLIMCSKAQPLNENEGTNSDSTMASILSDN